MPISSGQIFDFLQGGPNVSVYKDSNKLFISATTGSGGSFTGITGGTSIGTGISLFSAITNNNILLKSITSGPNVSVYENNGTIFISGSPSGVSGITNFGNGIYFLSSITSNNIIQKPFSATSSNLNVYEVDGQIFISATTESGLNIGGGIGVYSSTTSGIHSYRTISGGPNVSVYQNGDLIMISAVTGGSGGITGGTSIGTGIAVYSSATSTNLNFRSISGANGFEAILSGDLVVVRPLNRTINRVYVTDANGIQINSASLQVDNTNGTLGIGQAALTNARLSFPAAGSAMAQMLFTKGVTTPGTLADGMVWYLTSGDTLRFRKNAQTTDFIFTHNNISLTGQTNNRVLQTNSAGTITAPLNIVNFGLFNMITSVTVSNTTSELSLINTGITALVGTNILNSSSHLSQPQLVIGKKFRFNAKGEIQTRNSAAGNLTIKVYLGSTIIAQSSGITLTNNVNTPNVFDIDMTFTIRSQGASGTTIGSGMINCSIPFHTGGVTTFALFNQGVQTINTTVDQAFNVTAQWSVADSTNNLTINEATLEYLN